VIIKTPISSLILILTLGIEIMSITLDPSQGTLVDIFVKQNKLFAISNQGNIQLYDILSDQRLGHYGIDYSQALDQKVPSNYEFLSICRGAGDKVFIFGTQ